LSPFLLVYEIIQKGDKVFFHFFENIFERRTGLFVAIDSRRQQIPVASRKIKSGAGLNAIAKKDPREGRLRRFSSSYFTGR
jgi:hypothetical protein